MDTYDDEWKPRSKRRPGTKAYGIEYRLKDNRWHRNLFGETILNNWRPCKWYFTEAQRNEALNVLIKKDDIFEYRPTER